MDTGEGRSQPGPPRLSDSEPEASPPPPPSRRGGGGGAARAQDGGARGAGWSAALAGKLQEALSVECKAKPMRDYDLGLGFFFFSFW